MIRGILECGSLEKKRTFAIYNGQEKTSDGALSQSAGMIKVFDLSAYLSGVPVMAQVSAGQAVLMVPVLLVALVLFTFGGYKLQNRR